MSLWISVAVFLGVACLVGSLALLLRDNKDTKIEDRLDVLAGLKSVPSASTKEGVLKEGSLADLKQASTGAWHKFIARFDNYRYLFEQADVSLNAAQFVIISGALAVAGGAASYFVSPSAFAVPIAAMAMGAMPLFWVLLRRKKRLKLFGTQLPDALELVARALRAGHSLASGMNLVAEEMPAPIGNEFGRTFEEQNLGIALEDALHSLTIRVPNLDLKFFATAVILQRQTGGDLAEILDKIGYLVRERFRIWGQVQALTGEGRLSGIVLLALPPALFAVVYRMNPDYLMLLFTDDLGKKMLVGGVLSQIFGALVIRKIVNIRV
jgi:tight adherence protein B